MSHLKNCSAQFPGLKNATLLMDNAGGSQIAQPAIDAIINFYHDCNVQLGADYAPSVAAGERLKAARSAIAQWLNAHDSQEVIIGASSTALVRMLSLLLAQTWRKGDEIIITDVDHEANRSCWLDLEKQGLVIKQWQVNPNTHQLETAQLKALITNKTQILCCTHVSNIYGSINPIREWADIMHNNKAEICVDGVAFAPHRMLDVQQWDVDYYFFSTYKTFGPHQAVLYGKHKNLQKLPGINHRFIDKIPAKFEPGNVNYELVCGIHGAIDYLQGLGKSQASDNANPDLRHSLQTAFKAIADHEQELIEPFIDFINNHPDTTVIGQPTADSEQRVATVSFVHQHLDSQDVVEQANQQGFGIRYGDFYAVALIDALGLRQQHGVIRVSLAHYNNAEEVARLIAFFTTLFEQHD